MGFVIAQPILLAVQSRRYRDYSTGCGALPLAGQGFMLFLLRSGFIR